MSADGNNYGLNGNYEYNELLIDSFDATQPFNSSYSITNWPRIMLGKPMENVVAVKVLQATIPFKYYVVNSLNNTFLVGASLITVPVGSYTAAELATTLQTVSGTSSVTFSETTMKYTLNFGSATTLTFGTVGGDPRTNMGIVLGFNLGTTVSATSHVAPNVDQVRGPPYIYLNSRSLGAMINLYLNGSGIIDPTGSGADGPQIAMIPVNNTRGNNITYNDPDPQKWFYIGNQNLARSIDFYLTLGVGNEQIPLDMNGARFTVKLGILQSKMQGNDNLPSTQGNRRVVSKTWQAGGNMMQF